MVKIFQLPNIFSSQKGFSLIQLIGTLAITTILGTVITVSLWQTISIDGASNKHMRAISEVENALYYLNRDIQMSVPADDYVSGFPLTLQAGGSSIIYSLAIPLDGSPFYLQRNRNGVTQVVARYINVEPVLTSCYYTGGKFTITLTVTTGGFMSATESRILVASPRLVQ
jgi:hypothetical protein